MKKYHCVSFRNLRRYITAMRLMFWSKIYFSDIDFKLLSCSLSFIKRYSRYSVCWLAVKTYKAYILIEHALKQTTTQVLDIEKCFMYMSSVSNLRKGKKDLATTSTLDRHIFWDKKNDQLDKNVERHFF